MDSSTDFEVSSFFNRANTKALTEARTTPVILVCIYNKNSTLITHEILHNVFSLYGTILRILIFEKVKVWKAFIEYSSVDEAVEAKRNLNDFLLFNDGTRMNIYFSNLDTVKFQNNNSGGIDYTQNDQKDFTEFKNEYSSPEIQQNINNQPEAANTFQSSYQNGSNTYDQYIERPSSNNNSSQPNSAQLVKWPQPQVPDPDEDFLNFLNRQPIDKEPSKYEPENDSKQDLDDLDKEHLIQQFFNDGFSNNRGQQNLSFDNKPKGQQSLKLQSQPFNDPSQNSMHPSLQNSTPFWPQSLSSNNNNNNAAPPGLSFYSGSTQSSMQEPKHFHNELPKIMRMPGSLPHINLHHNPSPHNTPPISRHSTFTDLPQTSSLNSGPMNPGLLPPRHATFTDLPKPSMLPKSSLSHFGSMSHLPVSKPQQQQPGPSPFSSLGGGVMNQGGGNLNQQGSMNQIPQINKPSLNPRFASKPELPLASEISKMKLNDLSSQNVRDLIERDILLRLMMNNLQNQEGSDYLQQNPEIMEDLNDIKKFNPALSGLGNIDYNDLSQMNKGALDQIYQNLSSLLGKGVENKECAVLYVKGLEDENIKVQMLYNIFSNFGNIKKIIFIRRQAAALIEYETVEYATKAKDYLNNIVFMGKPLRIYYSFHPIINLKNKKSGKDSSEEIFLGTPKTFRFKKTKLLSMNPPSSTLHVSNLPKEICSEEIMRSAFSPFGRIEAIQFKFMDNNRNMCLIRMASMEESLNAMAHLHDLDLGGRPMQISFTKSKI